MCRLKTATSHNFSVKVVGSFQKAVGEQKQLIGLVECRHNKIFFLCIRAGENPHYRAQSMLLKHHCTPLFQTIEKLIHHLRGDHTRNERVGVEEGGAGKSR
jgi:hypothetical protein